MNFLDSIRLVQIAGVIFSGLSDRVRDTLRLLWIEEVAVMLMMSLLPSCSVSIFSFSSRMAER